MMAFFGVWSFLPDVSTLRTAYPVLHFSQTDAPNLPPRVTLSRRRPPGWVSLDGISSQAASAILVSEDWAFYQHSGYDVRQIRMALQADWQRKSFAHGASTITQQVARNVFLSREKSLWRKARELVLAARLDKAVGKKRVLEIYLNIAEWGPGVFGIREASEYYFGKMPSELGAKEGAFLAMLLPSPIRYGQSFRDRALTQYARETIDSILGKMLQAHLLGEAEASSERNRPLVFRSPNH